MSSTPTEEHGYVSEFLTHFVGRNLKEERAFDLLCKIIEEGILLPGGSKEKWAGNAMVNFSGRFSSNELLLPQVVCFCDIPLNKEMLEIHTKKYSKFGLAFEKKWLAKRGANPVFYIAQGSSCTDHRFPNNHPLRGTNRKDFFDLAVGDWLNDLVAKGRYPLHMRREDNLFFWYFLCYCKFFDETLEKDDPENYYMEREWRTIGQVKFKLNDIKKVILPKAYEGRFRRFISKFPTTLENEIYTI